MYKFYRVFADGAAKATKDEFETTAAYEARMSDMATLIAPIDPNALYAFATGLSVKYNADEQAFTIGSEDRSLCVGPDYQDKSPTVLCEITTHFMPSEDYVGQNAYGASTTIKRIRGEDLRVAVSRKQLISTGLFKSNVLKDLSFTRRLAMPLDQAATLRGKNIQVLIVGKVIGARLVDGRAVYSKPTINKPSDIFVPTYGIPFQPSGFVISVAETGQVLETLSLVGAN